MSQIIGRLRRKERMMRSDPQVEQSEHIQYLLSSLSCIDTKEKFKEKVLTENKVILKCSQRKYKGILLVNIIVKS